MIDDIKKKHLFNNIIYREAKSVIADIFTQEAQKDHAAKPIVLIKFGSHLYGTATEESDLDLKGIYLPSSRDIVLQKVVPVLSQKRDKGHGEKNTAQDIDCEWYSPAKYLSLLAEGQMMALDMLYAPEDCILQTSPIWLSLKKLAPQLLSKQLLSFVRYCKAQAYKYGMKGSRIQAAQLLLDLLSKAEIHYGATAKTYIIADDIQQLAALIEGIHLGKQPTHTGLELEYIEIGPKRILFTSSLKIARTVVQKLLDEYGHRAQVAALNEGIDWKALSHAIRIGNQALEFFASGHITFPRPEAAYLIAIKQGKVSYKKVAEEIEQLLTHVEYASQQTTLQETFDQSLIDNFIEQLYVQQIKSEYQ